MYIAQQGQEGPNLQFSYISIGIHPANPNNENNLVSFRKFAAQATVSVSVSLCVPFCVPLSVCVCERERARESNPSSGMAIDFGESMYKA